MDLFDNSALKRLETVLKKAGYVKPIKIINTLQGSIWRVKAAKSKKSVVVKLANRQLFSKGVVIVGKEVVESNEDIMKESKILSYLSSDPNCPRSIIKHVDCFQWYVDVHIVRCYKLSLTRALYIIV